MIFDIFHSLGRVDSLPKRLTDKDVFTQFFQQTKLAEDLGFRKVWVAESHFSSEVQKSHKEPVIPHYRGEVGLNADSFQLAHLVRQSTRKIGFGTAITNIVGGNGGPLAVADRVRMLAWTQKMLGLDSAPRDLSIGFASGRFPYINRPFGIVPRDPLETLIWPTIQRFIFIEAMEIFLRLSRGQVLSSTDITPHWLSRSLFSESHWDAIKDLSSQDKTFRIDDDRIRYRPRWEFDKMLLIPDMTPEELQVTFVLGSHDPLARRLGLKCSDLDIFNLSFTPPAEIDKTHVEMAGLIESLQSYPKQQREKPIAYKPWHRSRMPRTVLVFIDRDGKKARLRGEKALDIYRTAMAGTVQLPSQDDLMARALVGSPEEIVEQLQPGAAHGFQADDRLMLWFEFNQSEGESILSQMRLFADSVMPHYM